MKNIISLFVTLLALSSCGKKTETVSTPEANATTQTAVTQPAAHSQEELEDIVIPPAAKKQAKYFPEGTPSRAIQDLDDMLDSYILNPETPEQKHYNAALKRKVISGTFDVRELCRLALAKHWDERMPADQNYFVDLMIKLLEKKAIFSKEQGQKKQKTKVLYKVVYEGDKPLNPDNTQALARSTVHIPSENLKIGLNYKLKKIDGQWKIYDVVVDEASLLDNYKYQFDKIIAKDGYPTLIHRMESKLQELQEQKG